MRSRRPALSVSHPPARPPATRSPAGTRPGPELGAGTATFVGWLVNHAVAFGGLGLISGFSLGLVLVHVAQREGWTTLPRRGIALWSAVAGMAPALFLAVLAVGFAAPSTGFLPLAALGIASGAGSALLDVRSGQAVVTAPGEWVRYSAPGAEGAEYIAVCLAEFSPAAVHREEG